MKTTTVLLALFVLPVSSQTYTEDSLAVRAILDTNGLVGATVESVTETADSRITALTVRTPGVVLPSSSVGSLTALRTLDIRGCELRTLPEQLTMLKWLRTLRISDNPLGDLPAWISELDSLRDLVATGCQLAQLPEEIGELRNLEALRLAYNRLTTLPASIGSLSNLGYVALHDNLLQSLPETLGDIARLRDIALSNNRFDEFPACLTRITHIRGISLYGNALRALPESIGALVDIGEFDLTSNELSSLPGSITRVGSMMGGLYLFVDDNRLCSLPDSIEQWVTDGNSGSTAWKTTQRCAQSTVSPQPSRLRPFGQPAAELFAHPCASSLASVTHHIPNEGGGARLATTGTAGI